MKKNRALFVSFPSALAYSSLPPEERLQTSADSKLVIDALELVEPASEAASELRQLIELVEDSIRLPTCRVIKTGRSSDDPSVASSALGDGFRSTAGTARSTLRLGSGDIACDSSSSSDELPAK